MKTVAYLTVATLLAAPSSVLAQTGPAGPQPRQPRPGAAAARPGPAEAPTPPDYVIGPEDVIGILFWRDAEMSGDVTVRPDGMITLPLVRDIKAQGLTPDALRDAIQKAASQYMTDPVVTVVVKQINSRKVFITGQVANPGSFPLTSAMTVMQLIAVAGGLTEFANAKAITVMRTAGGRSEVLKFNYKDVARGRRVEQNVTLRPGDTVVVP